MKYLIQLIIFYSLFTTILFAQKPFVLETDLLETIPPENLTFLEGVDHDVSFEVLEKAEWENKLIQSQSLVDGYWVKFQIHNKLDSNEIGLNHNWNVEKKIFVKNSLGLTEFPYWMYQRNSFWGEGRIGAQYLIIMPKNEITIIYDFFRSKPFDRFMAKVNGLDRMTIGLWKDVRLRELVRFSGNIGFMSVALSFGLYYFFIYLVSRGNYLWLSLSLFQATALVFFTQSNSMYIGIDRAFAVGDAIFVFQGVLFIFLIQFFREALELEKNYPRINKFFWIGIIFYALMAILNFITALNWPHDSQYDLIRFPPDNLGPGIIKLHIFVIPVGIFLILSILISLILWKRGDSSAGYLCLSFLLPFLVIPIGALAYIITGGFNWKTMLITTTAGGFLFISMFVTFGFAIAQRINDLKKLALEQQMRLTEAYQRFVPDQLLKNLDKDSILDVQLGDQVQKEMSIMFSDIRSFTSLSESMTPEENFKFVNSYLSKMGPLVREHNGYIDKYIGDAIMALFERSPEDAVRTSIKMLKTLREYNEGRNRAGYELIQIGVGVNTGMMILGTLGEADRMEGSVISDAVNLAARLEGLTKLYKTPLLISETTMNQLSPEAFQIRLIDRVAVKGKEDPVLVYEVLDTHLSEIMQRKIYNLDHFNNGFDLYQNQKFGKALQLFRECYENVPEDKVSELYIERCEMLISQGWNAETWNGINYMETK